LKARTPKKLKKLDFWWHHLRRRKVRTTQWFPMKELDGSVEKKRSQEKGEKNTRRANTKKGGQDQDTPRWSYLANVENEKNSICEATESTPIKKITATVQSFIGLVKKGGERRRKKKGGNSSMNVVPHICRQERGRQIARNMKWFQHGEYKDELGW